MKTQIALSILALSMFNVACSQNLPDAVNTNATNASSTAAGSSSSGTLSTVTLPPDSTTTTTTTAGTGLVDSTGLPVVSGQAYFFKNAATGNCLDVSGANTADGTLVQPYPCGAGKTNQLWQVSLNSDGTFTLIGVGSQKPLNLDTNRIPAADGILQIYSTSSGGLQSFMITAAAGGYSIIPTLSPTQSIENTANSKMLAETSTAASNQAFILIPSTATTF